MPQLRFSRSLIGSHFGEPLLKIISRAFLKISVLLFLCFLNVGHCTGLNEAKEMVKLVATKLQATEPSHEDEKRIFEDFSDQLESFNLDDDETTALLRYMRNAGYESIIYTRYYAYEMRAEKLMVRKIIAGESDTPHGIHESDALYKLLLSEMSLIDGVKGKRILFIGSGALPYSALAAQRMSGVTVAMLDSDKEALELSEQYIEKIGLKDKFEFLYGDAQSQDVSRYDLVWVAAMVKPKQAVLDALHKTLRSDAVLLVRQAQGVGQLLYGDFENFDNQGFRIEKQVINQLAFPVCGQLLKRL
ncbi:MAG TPA: nicotianamine synthase family protein [Bdellovibrionota bacterium]|nr:nicotianamine synthase family protein [Bdellovibrionota bacterium]